MFLKNNDIFKANWQKPSIQKEIATFFKYLESQGIDPSEYCVQFSGISINKNAYVMKHVYKLWNIKPRTTWDGFQFSSHYKRPMSLRLYGDTVNEHWIGICSRDKKEWDFKLVCRENTAAITVSDLDTLIEKELTPRQYELYLEFKNSERVFKDVWDSPISQTMSLKSIKHVMHVIEQSQKAKKEKSNIVNNMEN